MSSKNMEAGSGGESPADDDQDIRSRLVAETSKIPWQELQRFFAGGSVLYIDPELDLIDVACEIAADHAERVSAWTDEGRVAPVKDAQALEWLEANALVWATVIRPWVLVQPVLAGLNEGYGENPS